METITDIVVMVAADDPIKIAAAIFDTEQMIKRGNWVMGANICEVTNTYTITCERVRGTYYDL